MLHQPNGILCAMETRHIWKLIDDARTRVTDPSDVEAIVPGDLAEVAEPVADAYHVIAPKRLVARLAVAESGTPG
jgi:hypothetical protein